VSLKSREREKRKRGRGKREEGKKKGGRRDRNEKGTVGAFGKLDNKIQSLTTSFYLDNKLGGFKCRVYFFII
jgi:hypothetical protein